MKREFHRSAGFVVFREDGCRRFLLVRSALTRRPVWEFPKGAIEEGERERDAAVRELEEETALAPGSYSVFEGFREEEHYHFLRGEGADRRLIRKVVVYFLAEWESGEVRISPEATRFTWAELPEASRLLRFPEKRRVLARADRFITELERPPILDAEPLRLTLPSPQPLEIPLPPAGGK
jgi:8-oxo-dGTP pyrophosphatase MutT (NUDIX family)